MLQKIAVPFTRKISISFFISLGILMVIALFQLIIMWLTDKTYSMFIMPHFNMNYYALKIMAIIIVIINILFFSGMTLKVVKWKKRRLVLRNSLVIWGASFGMILINILIPSSLPLNFIFPIAYLLGAVIATVSL